MDRCKFKSKIFENIVFTLKSIYFVSFQYKAKEILSLSTRKKSFFSFFFSSSHEYFLEIL